MELKGASKNCLFSILYLPLKLAEKNKARYLTKTVALHHEMQRKQLCCIKQFNSLSIKPPCNIV